MAANYANYAKLGREMGAPLVRASGPHVCLRLCGVEFRSEGLSNRMSPHVEGHPFSLTLGLGSSN